MERKRAVTRRTFLERGLQLSAAAGMLGAVGAEAADGAADRPNVILIFADDLSAKELSCYGNQDIRTPNLDRMARDGVMFRTGWSTPLCGPSRATLHTGQYAARTGYYDNDIRPTTPFWKTHMTLGQAMKRAGYATAMYGKIHHGGDPRDYGFDEYCVAQYWDGYDGPNQAMGPPDHGMYAIQWYWHPGLVENGEGVPTTPDDFGPDMEVARLNAFVRDHKDAPFFVYWPTNLIHMEHREGGTWHYTDVPELDAEGRPTGGRVPGSCKATTEYLDHLVGRILANLDETGLRERTIVLFIGDNGTAEYGKNRLQSEIAIRVPYIAYGPGRVRALGARDELVDLTDVLPTLLDLADSAPPEGYALDGRSFAPLLFGEPFTPRDWIYAQLNEARWLRDTRWLLDGSGRFYDCGDARDDTQGYPDVTESHDPEVIAARKRFEAILNQFPQPDFDDPETLARWQAHWDRAGRKPPYRPPYLDEASDPSASVE